MPSIQLRLQQANQTFAMTFMDLDGLKPSR